jgi:hypothetical protein
MEGTRMGENRADVSNYQNTPADAPIGFYDALEAIKHTLAHGVGIKHWYDQNLDHDITNYTLGPTLWRYGERYKAFIRGRFLCLDIDRKPADIAADPEHGDGLRNFEAFLNRVGKPPALRPQALRDIAAGSFPCYVTTPSNGLHLYFKYAGPPVKGILTTHVEIKTWTITAPGSFKDGKPYRLRGSMSDAPPLYGFGFILDALPKQKEAPVKQFRPLQEKKDWGLPSREKLVEWTDADGRGTAGRNEWTYSFALHAKTHRWNKTDTLEVLQNEPRISGLPEQEIISAVESAYRSES